MPDTLADIDRQIADTEENLLLIEKRKSEFVEQERRDLQLDKNEQHWQRQLHELAARWWRS